MTSWQLRMPRRKSDKLTDAHFISHLPAKKIGKGQIVVLIRGAQQTLTIKDARYLPLINSLSQNDSIKISIRKKNQLTHIQRS